MQPAFLKKRLIDTLKSALDNYENKINEFESVIAFVIYIAKQDKNCLEKNELLADLPLIKKLYFDEYGEFIKSEAIEQIGLIEKIKCLGFFI